VDEEDEEDPFAEVGLARFECNINYFSLLQIDEGFSEEDLESNLQRDKYARLCTTVTQLIDELTPSAPEFQLQNACIQIVGPCF